MPWSVDVFKGCSIKCDQTILIWEYPRKQSSWGQHGAHLGPVGPIWAPCWPHEPCYLGCLDEIMKMNKGLLKMTRFRVCERLPYTSFVNMVVWKRSSAVRIASKQDKWTIWESKQNIVRRKHTYTDAQCDWILQFSLNGCLFCFFFLWCVWVVCVCVCVCVWGGGGGGGYLGGI